MLATKRRSSALSARLTTVTSDATPRARITPRRLVCRERSIVRGDGGRFKTPPPSRLEARSRLSQHSCSFDHLVGAGEERGWDGEAKGLRRIQVDNQLVLARQLYRKFGGL